MKEPSKLKQKKIFIFFRFPHLYIHIIINVWTFWVRFFLLLFIFRCRRSVDFSTVLLVYCYLKNWTRIAKVVAMGTLLSIYLSRYRERDFVIHSICCCVYLKRTYVCVWVLLFEIQCVGLKPVVEHTKESTPYESIPVYVLHLVIWYASWA